MSNRNPAGTTNDALAASVTEVQSSIDAVQLDVDGISDVQSSVNAMQIDVTALAGGGGGELIFYGTEAGAVELPELGIYLITGDNGVGITYTAGVDTVVETEINPVPTISNNAYYHGTRNVKLVGLAYIKSIYKIA